MNTQPNKAVFAGLTAVATGLGFLVSAGTLHGSALIGVQAGIAAVDSVLSTYGVWRVTNKTGR